MTSLWLVAALPALPRTTARPAYAGGPVSACAEANLLAARGGGLALCAFNIIKEKNMNTRRVLHTGLMLVVSLAVAVSAWGMLPAQKAAAAACTFTSNATGNWNAAIWTTSGGTGCGAYPGASFAGDTVVISAGNIVTLNVSPANAIASLTLNGGAAGSASRVTISGSNSLTISGAITINPQSSGGSGTANYVNVAAGTLSAGSVSLLGTTSSSRLTQILISTGTATVSGNITSAGTASQIVFSGAGTLNAGGTFMSGTVGSFTAGTGTVNFNAAGAQAVAPFAYTFNNLTLSGSGAKDLTNATVNGNLTLSGTATATTPAAMTIGGNLLIGDSTTFTAAGYALTVTGTTTIGGGTSGNLTISSATGTKIFTGLVTINTGGTWTNTAANSPVTFRGGITNNGTFNAGTGVHTFDTNSQALAGTLSIPSVTVTGAAVILTNNGTLTVGTALAGTGRLTNAATGTLNIGGTSGITTLTATASGNTVNYNGAAQTVKATTYYNLTFSGSGAKSITLANNATLASGNLSIAPTGSATANINGTNLGVNSLTLGGFGKNSGTWGSTSSAATNQDNTYFALTTGYLTVSTDNRLTQAITFTSTAPGSAVVGGATYAPAATGGASGNAVVFTIDATATSVCSISGGVVSFNTPGTCVINANQAGNANYNAAPQVQQSFAVEVTLTVNIVGSGSVTRNPNQATYPSGTVVTVTAVPAPGWSFSAWSGDLVSADNPVTITINANKTVTATFTLNTYPLTVTKTGTGTGVVSSIPSGIDCGLTCSASFNYNTVVSLTATADAGSTFTGWSDVSCSGLNPCPVTIDSAKTVTATFTQNPPNTHALSVSKLGTGIGTVSSVPGGIDCGATCAAFFDEGTVVTLTASANPGSSFASWSGDATGTTSPITLTMDSIKTVTATFTLNAYTLTVHTVGSGSVAKNPDQSTYHYGDVVTLTASADPGSSFASWSGDATGTTSPITLTMDSNKTVTATFTLNAYTLTVHTVGSGSVAMNPDQSTYHYSDVVTLTATPSIAWSFAGWSGDLTGATSPITLTMDSDKTVTATFALVAIDNPPIANAGPDQTVYVNSSVTLNGSASTDPDGHLPLSFGWAQTGGPAVSFNRTLSVTTFTAPGMPQVLTFTLTVTDTLSLASTPDMVVVTVQKHYIYLPVIMKNAP